MDRFRAGECPCCGHHNNWNDTIGPNTVSDSDSDTDTDSDDLHFNPNVFDDDNTPQNYFDDNDDNQPFGGGAITV